MSEIIKSFVGISDGTEKVTMTYGTNGECTVISEFPNGMRLVIIDYADGSRSVCGACPDYCFELISPEGKLIFSTFVDAEGNIQNLEFR